MALRRGRITAEQAAEFTAKLGGVSIRLNPLSAPPNGWRLLGLAQQHRLTAGLIAYDAAYPNCPGVRAPLATVDGDLIRAA